MMKRIPSVLLALVLLALPLGAFAQTPVQQSPTMLNACSGRNATAAIANAVTLTIPAPPSGQYIYLCGVDFQVSNDATGGTVAQSNVCFTTTNLSSAQWCYSQVTGVANTQVLIGQQAYYFPGWAVKSANPSTAVTIVSPASMTHSIYNINAYYYTAP
jgi:hypothetical protein